MSMMSKLLPRLRKPIENYPFLLNHLGTNNTAKKKYNHIIGDCEDLGKTFNSKDLDDDFTTLQSDEDV